MQFSLNNIVVYCNLTLIFIVLDASFISYQHIVLLKTCYNKVCITVVNTPTVKPSYLNFSFGSKMEVRATEMSVITRHCTGIINSNRILNKRLARKATSVVSFSP